MTPSPSLQQFLSLVAYAEGTGTSRITQNHGYDIIVSGPDGPERFDDYSHHPFAGGRPAKFVGKNKAGKDVFSTASGRYQILYSPIWVPYQKVLHLPDFSPASQDAVAIQLITECKAVADIAAGNIEQAIIKCNSRWASLPGNTDGQGGKTMGDLLNQWQTLSKETV